MLRHTADGGQRTEGAHSSLRTHNTLTMIRSTKLSIAVKSRTPALASLRIKDVNAAAAPSAPVDAFAAQAALALGAAAAAPAPPPMLRLVYAAAPAEGDPPSEGDFSSLLVEQIYEQLHKKAGWLRVCDGRGAPIVVRSNASGAAAGGAGLAFDCGESHVVGGYDAVSLSVSGAAETATSSSLRVTAEVYRATVRGALDVDALLKIVGAARRAAFEQGQFLDLGADLESCDSEGASLEPFRCVVLPTLTPGTVTGIGKAPPPGAPSPAALALHWEQKYGYVGIPDSVWLTVVADGAPGSYKIAKPTVYPCACVRGAQQGTAGADQRHASEEAVARIGSALCKSLQSIAPELAIQGYGTLISSVPSEPQVEQSARKAAALASAAQAGSGLFHSGSGKQLAQPGVRPAPMQCDDGGGGSAAQSKQGAHATPRKQPSGPPTVPTIGNKRHKRADGKPKASSSSSEAPGSGTGFSSVCSGAASSSAPKKQAVRALVPGAADATAPSAAGKQKAQAKPKARKKAAPTPKATAAAATAADAAAGPVEPVVFLDSYTETELTKKQIKDLKAILKHRKKKVGGKKAALVQRCLESNILVIGGAAPAAAAAAVPAAVPAAASAAAAPAVPAAVVAAVVAAAAAAPA